MARGTFEQRVRAVRQFNRFYTRRIGVLEGGLLKSPFSLTEVRVLYELSHRDRPSAAQLARELGLDAGYLSRILRGFQRRGLVAREPSKDDGRQSLLRLTERGRKTFAPLDARAREEVSVMLRGLSEPGQDRLVGSLGTVERLLGGRLGTEATICLRTHRPGDMGWVVHRHGALYAEEYGWDGRFEALVAEIAAKFLRDFDPRRERCWIAVRDGEPAGSVLLVKKTERVGQLRLLLVEPSARGLGIGRRLVDECLRFARRVGYHRVMLWTNDVLHAARHVYQAAGFRMLREEPHQEFGHGLVSQTWEKDLRN
jgi:DNA-binding MarR family transcriptional regulator/N-acetylglutamate synthase-like GNAT family acetyltransferase